MTAAEVLKASRVFSALSDSELEKVASLAEEREYRAGSTIFQEGDRAEELMVLQEGRVALQMPLPAPAQVGKRITVDIVAANEVLGWSAIVEPHVYTLTAVCLQKTRVLAIDGVKLRALFRDNHHIGYEILSGLIRVVASRLNDTRQVLISERLLPAKAE